MTIKPKVVTDHADLKNCSDEKAPESTAIESVIFYLDRLPLYTTEKPYSMRYLPTDPIPQTSCQKVRYPTIFMSMREPEVESFKIDECGFEVMNMESSMSYGDFWDYDRIQNVYLEEVKERLKAQLNAKYVYVLDYAIRRRHESFPHSTGEEYEHNQPAAMAHVDFTYQEALRIINILFGERANEVLKGRWQAVNVWKPIAGPLNDWPLGLCDATSVDLEKDTLRCDIVFDDFVTENLQTMYNPNHRWYYLPDHGIDEALIFKSADSEDSKASAVPHAAFFNLGADEGHFRESIDLRSFVFFEDLDEYPPVVGDVFQANIHTI